MKLFGRITGALVLCLGMMLVTASSAFAATIRYDIPPSPAYTVDNKQGIAKVTFNGCVTQAAAQTLAFTTVIEGGTAGTAEYKVLQRESDEGELPAATFDPPSITVVGTGTQTFDTTLTFTLNQVSPSGTVFRFKLDPEEAIGLGEGPGVMVKIECVVPKAIVAPAGPPVAGTTPVPMVPLVRPAAAMAQGPAPCIALRRVTLRAARRSTIHIVVRTAAGVRVNRAFVRIVGAGVRRSGFTNFQGVATFAVRPPRAGTLVIQSNVCIGADLKAVLGAAAGASGAGAGSPSFTG